MQIPSWTEQTRPCNMFQGHVAVDSIGQMWALFWETSSTVLDITDLLFIRCIRCLLEHKRTFTRGYVFFLCVCVPGAFVKSTWNWISIDLHWQSLGLHVLGQSAAHQPPKLRAQHPACNCGIHISLVFCLSQFHQCLLSPAIQKLHG